MRRFAPFLLALAAAAQEPVVYTIRVPAPEQHRAAIELRAPTGGAPQLDLWMGSWSPGFYRVENHWQRIEVLGAKAADGTALAIERPADGHWAVATGGAAVVVVDYRVDGGGHAVTGDRLDPAYGIFNGVASYLTWNGAAHLRHEVRLELPACWPDTATGLAPSADGEPHHYTAPDFDTLADAPIVAGPLRRTGFEAAGVRHELVDFGDYGTWDAARATAKLAPIVAEHARMFGGLPFARYVFLNAFGPGGGGLEHLNSTLISASKNGAPDAVDWLMFVSHEYFHAFNVKRLRPVELGPFDYEHAPRTESLWIAEGLTTYYGDLAVVRAGIATRADWLQRMSRNIHTVQTTPGRLVMTLAEASADVWTKSMSGIMGNRARTISYYEKGPVVGFLLDAAIRRATADAKSLDDVMRLTYARYGGAKGYTPRQWEAAAAEVAGTDLAPFFASAVRSVDELDYAPALAWFGLAFAPPGDGGKASWQLVETADANDEQRAHLAHLLAATPERR